MIENSDITILVAEDDELNFIYLEKVLSIYKYRIIHAWNGAEAIELFSNTAEIDLILMDIKMPLIDGFEATKEIRKKDKDIPIIAQTAYAMAGDKEVSINAGCNDYISKPISEEKLIDIINKYSIQK